jgi:hypothetical protein
MKPDVIAAHRPLPSFFHFLLQISRHAAVGAGFVLASLWVGASGYHAFAGFAWLDAWLNAAMILTGMGPVDPLTTTEGKLFGIFYALYSGVAFLTLVAVLFAPVAQRFLHRFHLELYDEPSGGAER